MEVVARARGAAHDDGACRVGGGAHAARGGAWVNDFAPHWVTDGDVHFGGSGDLFVAARRYRQRGFDGGVLLARSEAGTVVRGDDDLCGTGDRFVVGHAG